MEKPTLQELTARLAEQGRFSANRAVAAYLRPAVPGTLAYEMLRNRASAESDRIRVEYVQPKNAPAVSPFDEEVLV